MKKKNMKVLSVCSLASLVISGSVISTTGVKAADTNTTTRLGGSDRYETAVKISQNGWKSGSDYVVLANGQGFADALCANPIAKSKNAPILLTESTSLNSSTLAELKRLNAKHVIIVGGTGVVPTAIENTIKTQLNADVTRYGGADRYETSVKIAAALGNTSKIVLASGRDFADALSAGPAASIEGIPVVLTQPDQLPSTTSDYIKGNTNLTKTYVIGGTGSVSASLYNTLKNPERFGGIDRFETNAKVIDGFKSDFNFNNAYVALGKGPIGNEFADSLTGGALAAKNKNPLVITSNPISSYTTGILKDKLNTSSTLTILGGTGNITDTMISTLKDAITNSPSTGGGGGSSQTSSPLPIVNNTEGSSYKTYVEKFNADSTLSKYATIGKSNSSSIVNVTLKDENPIKSAFRNAQTSQNIDQKIADAQKQIDDISSGAKLGSLTIDGDNLKTFLGKLDSKYIDKDGNLNVDKIKEEISERQDEGYTDFRNELKERIETYITTHNNADTSISIKGFKLSSVTNGSTTVYDGSNSQSIVDLLLPVSDAKGTYTVNLQDSNNELFYFKINAQYGN
ncbi:cell wall-binding repeat-containing protein [Clostridium tyrobutyricum]|uniref:cell wall-binding repeat-containing protein n=1 Tax=Clostridium tyrobutyricum TaxID=1519 RepID=UPI000319587E|nr:cell wall-binding repeat-containing protein [Clostridium tyrobutyricum]MEA5007101.1 cell wall-binding repeat-containing protein [Clostridium tyrobutyricum]